MFYRKVGKRVVDLLVSFAVLIVTLPVTILTAAALAIQNRGEIFFYQRRPGFKEKPFYIIKFKTMSDQRDEVGELLPNIDRITVIGNWVRKLSLDELPQLINVLKGEMSLVGPRPLLDRYIPLYTEAQRGRHDVKPGITGWAQVNGRNSISWQQKFEHDLYYVENMSFELDMRILWMTILKVVKREGVNQTEVSPVEPFDGTN